MEEIQLIKTSKNGMNYQPQLVNRISSIDSIEWEIPQDSIPNGLNG